MERAALRGQIARGGSPRRVRRREAVMRHRSLVSTLGALTLALVATSGRAATPSASLAGPVASAVLSPALKDIVPAPAKAADARRTVLNLALPEHPRAAGVPAPADGARQTAASASVAAPTGVSFDGI